MKCCNAFWRYFRFNNWKVRRMFYHTHFAINKWPENDRQHQGQRHPMHVLLMSQSQILPHFTIWPTIFELQSFLQWVTYVTPNWHWTLQGKSTIYAYVILISPSPKFYPFLLCDKLFSRYMSFKDKCTIKKYYYIWKYLEISAWDWAHIPPYVFAYHPDRRILIAHTKVF